MAQSPPDESRAVAVDPRNDDWVRGAQPLITRADDGFGMAFVVLIAGVLLAPMLYLAILTRDAMAAAGASVLLLLMGGSLILFVLDMRDRRKVSAGRRIAARVTAAQTQVPRSSRGTVTYSVKSEFVSPRTGEALSASIGGPATALRPVKIGDPVWVAYVDDGCFEAL